MITKFSWESGSATTADYGKNALSISSYAFVSADGANGTKGLNAGTGSHDINMALTASDYTLPSLDIQVDFKRKESDAYFFTLGNFNFGESGGSLFAKFPLVKGSSDTTINATGLYSLPSDNAFHTYRFKYISTTGVATVSVDGATVYTYTRTGGAALSWTSVGSSNAMVGTLMDGTSSNVAVLDNLIIQVPAANTLPLQLLSFDAQANGDAVDLNWTSTHEINTQSFEIERSADGIDFSGIGKVAASQNYSSTSKYQYTDAAPAAGDNYYRLKMTDIDGAYTYSSVKKISSSVVVTSVSCYPNPVVNQVNVKMEHVKTAVSYRYNVIAVDGRVLQSGVMNVGSGTTQNSINVSSAPKGVLLVQLQNADTHSAETFKIVKI